MFIGRRTQKSAALVEDEIIDPVCLPLDSQLSPQSDTSGAECGDSIFDYYNGHPSVDLDDLHFDSANTENAFEKDCSKSPCVSCSENFENVDRTNVMGNTVLSVSNSQHWDDACTENMKNGSCSASECFRPATIGHGEPQSVVTGLNRSSVPRVADELSDSSLFPQCAQTVADSKAQNTRQLSRLPGPRSRPAVRGNSAQANGLTAVGSRNPAV